MGVYLVVSITPIGIQNLGWRFYIVFAVLNAAFLPFIWFFYVEVSLQARGVLATVHWLT